MNRQRRIPALMRARFVEQRRQELIKEANEQHASRPQYTGHWDNWQVVRVVEDVRTKLGLAFEMGDYALMQPESVTGIYRTVYSFRNKCDTSIRARSVEVL